MRRQLYGIPDYSSDSPRPDWRLVRRLSSLFYRDPGPAFRRALLRCSLEHPQGSELRQLLPCSDCRAPPPDPPAGRRVFAAAATTVPAVDISHKVPPSSSVTSRDFATLPQSLNRQFSRDPTGP